MKTRTLIFSFIFATCATPSATSRNATPRICQGPPQSYEAGRLVQCHRDDSYFACALVFTTSSGDTCAHIVVQDADDCSAKWEYIGVTCAGLGSEQKSDVEQIDVEEQIDTEI